MYEIIGSSQNEDTLFGKLHANEALPNLKEITVEEFSQSQFFTYSPTLSGYRQIHGDWLTKAKIKPDTDSNNRPVLFLAIHWFMFHDKTGIAFSHDYWKKKVRYFKFAVCEHDCNSKTVGNCLTRYTCVKCGYSYELDSSD